MSDPHDAHAKAREFFDGIWGRGDFWQFETSEFEQRKYRRQLELLGDGRLGDALEIGCGSGCFSRLLAGLADRVVALDVSALAIERALAQPAGKGAGAVDFRVANVMEFDPVAEGPWDLVVMSETIYYLGWLYPFWDVAWLAKQLFDATAPGGRLLMANTRVTVQNRDYLLQPWIIHTYRDLFINVGYEAAVEEVFCGEKEGGGARGAHHRVPAGVRAGALTLGHGHERSRKRSTALRARFRLLSTCERSSAVGFLVI